MLKIYLFISFLFISQAKSQLTDGYEAGDFRLNWIDSGNTLDFVFSTRVRATNNVWSAFALSMDNMMGNDDAVICKIFGNEKTVERYHTTGKNRPQLLSIDDPTIGLSDISISLQDNILTCSFSRIKYIPGVRNYYNLNKKYYLLFAKGRTDNSGLIQYHGGSKLRSSTPIQF